MENGSIVDPWMQAWLEWQRHKRHVPPKVEEHRERKRTKEPCGHDPELRERGSCKMCAYEKFEKERKRRLVKVHVHGGSMFYEVRGAIEWMKAYENA